MFKRSRLLCLTLLSSCGFAAESVDYYQAPLNQLEHYNLRSKSVTDKKSNSLRPLNTTTTGDKTNTRYQQFYRGVPVVGEQVILTQNTQGTKVNGHLLEDLNIDIKPKLSPQEALELAKKAYFKNQLAGTIKEESITLQIRSLEVEKPLLVYQVDFKSLSEDNKPLWPFFIIDAQTGSLLKEWNNIKYYLEKGPGGNENVHEYWYGKEGLPALDVTKKGPFCIMDDPQVKLVQVHQAWDWENTITKAFEYLCGNNVAEDTNGAYSPTNDAYYFGHTIVDMYKNWYGVHALQHPDGSPMQLVMRVHFGKNYDNAFWDGRAMSFGDGLDFLPLVSLDIAAHEVTHGFTEQHANLEYHDQSGALNESMSDMAGQAAKAYLLETLPLLYNKAHLKPNEVTWGIGETIMRAAFGKALRFMDMPSSDGYSADCLDKNIAQGHGAYCAISYPELVAYAAVAFSDPEQRQSYIVHTASGVFNKAFYLWSQEVGIKNAYRTMLLANTKYWTSTTGFLDGACGCLYAAKDFQLNITQLKTVFGQVGIDTQKCAI